MARATEVRELLDGPLPAADLRATLDDLDRLNTWFGGEARALPLLACAADVAVAALTLHHLAPDEAMAALTAMTGAARVVVVNDLLRTPAALALVSLATRTRRLHPVSRHDGPMSVRRAYSADELTARVRRIGPGVRVSS